jgi:hypothetical protein
MCGRSIWTISTLLRAFETDAHTNAAHRISEIRDALHVEEQKTALCKLQWREIVAATRKANEGDTMVRVPMADVSGSMEWSMNGAPMRASIALSLLLMDVNPNSSHEFLRKYTCAHVQQWKVNTDLLSHMPSNLTVLCDSLRYPSFLFHHEDILFRALGSKTSPAPTLTTQSIFDTLRATTRSKLDIQTF